MAENLKTLKRRIKTAKNISQIAKAMEMISATKIKRAKEAVENNRPYAEKIHELLENILRNLEVNEFTHPFLKSNNSKNKLIIALSPDKGLCGALIDNINKKLLEFGGVKNYSIVTIGKKIERFSVKLNMNNIAAFNMGATLPKYDVIFPVYEIISKYYMAGNASEVYLLYADFKSIFNQVPVITKLLPVEIKDNTIKKEDVVYKFEPNANSILEDLLPFYIETKLYSSMINAFTSEQAARMVSMQNAKNNAIDISNYINLLYNKLRQSKITNEILDITNSQIAS